jgi:predicted GIY-YIG superfamily endonuclease
MPQAGIHWITDSYWGPAKILLGLQAIQYPGEGHRGLWKNREQLRQLVCDTMPGDAEALFKRVSTHKEEKFANVLARRAKFCRPEDRGGYDELERFLRPDWVPTTSLMRDAWLNPRKLHMDDLMEAQERIFVLKYSGSPGVYLLQNSMAMNQVYIGKGDDLIARALSHTNTFYRLVRCYPTASIRTALELEKSIHNRLKLTKGITWRPGRSGAYLFNHDDGVAEVDKLIIDYYRHFLHQTVRLID